MIAERDLEIQTKTELFLLVFGIGQVMGFHIIINNLMIAVQKTVYKNC